MPMDGQNSAALLMYLGKLETTSLSWSRPTTDQIAFTAHALNSAGDWSHIRDLDVIACFDVRRTFPQTGS